jgi:hypothetical protein
MPTSISGAAELRLALRKFAPDLAKETRIEMANALRTVTAVARGFVPSDSDMLSGWSNPIGSETLQYRPFPKYSAREARAGIAYSVSPSRPNKSGFISLARIVNKSAAGAIYETAGRKNPNGQPNYQRKSFVYRTGSNGPGDFQINYYEEKANTYRKGYNNSLNPNAPAQFLENINASGILTNARPMGMKGRPSRKQTGRLIFRAWAEDNGVANAAVLLAIEKSARRFNQITKKAA